MANFKRSSFTSGAVSNLSIQKRRTTMQLTASMTVTGRVIIVFYWLKWRTESLQCFAWTPCTHRRVQDFF